MHIRRFGVEQAIRLMIPIGALAPQCSTIRIMLRINWLCVPETTGDAAPESRALQQTRLGRVLFGRGNLAGHRRDDRMPPAELHRSQDAPDQTAPPSAGWLPRIVRRRSLPRRQGSPKVNRRWRCCNTVKPHYCPATLIVRILTASAVDICAAATPSRWRNGYSVLFNPR